MKLLRIVLATLLLASAGAFAAEQVVNSAPNPQAVAPSTAVSFTATYTSQNPQDETTTGLGLRIHYDSSQLTYNSLSGLFASGAQPVSEQADAGNEDGDATTDRVVLVSWIDVGANWPGAGNEPTNLFTANFTTTAGFTGTTINYTASSTAPGYTLVAPSVQIDLATTVPDVVGQTQADATAAIIAAGLTVGAVTNAGSATVPAGSVISQNPAAGASVGGGSAVDLVVSTGPIVVPDVVGQDQATASANITAAGLTPQINLVFDGAPAGTVIAQNPAAGSNASQNDDVVLTVSQGPAPAGGGATGVPTLSQWALILLAMLVGLVAWKRHDKQV